MSSPLKKVMCVGAVSVFMRVAHPFTTHRYPSHARLCGLASPLAKYACHPSRSGLPGWAVGGVFMCAVHGRTLRPVGVFINHNDI